MQHKLHTQFPADYVPVAAGQTAAVVSQRAGDVLQRLILIPENVSPGDVSIVDGSTSIKVFDGGTNALTEKRPIVIEIGAKATGAGWKITTGADVAAIAVGYFS